MLLLFPKRAPLSIQVKCKRIDIILLWSRLVGQLLFSDINTADIFINTAAIFFFVCVCVCVLLLDSFCWIQLLKGCISRTAIISAVHGTVFHYSLHFGSILSRLLTLLISRLISNISFIQLSSLLSGYPASSFTEST